MKVYLDGRRSAVSPLYAHQPTRSSSVQAAIGDTAVGRGWRFRGKLDEVMIFDRALSDAEVEQLYQSKKPQLP